MADLIFPIVFIAAAVGAIVAIIQYWGDLMFQLFYGMIYSGAAVVLAMFGIIIVALT